MLSHHNYVYNRLNKISFIVLCGQIYSPYPPPLSLSINLSLAQCCFQLGHKYLETFIQFQCFMLEVWGAGASLPVCLSLCLSHSVSLSVSLSLSLSPSKENYFFSDWQPCRSDLQSGWCHKTSRPVEVFCRAPQFGRQISTLQPSK